MDLTGRSVAILLLCSNTMTSRKLILEGETSWVNLMVSSEELVKLTKSMSFSFPWGDIIKTSSM